MDIGIPMINTDFYDGYEGEPEITLIYNEYPECSIHIWDGYIGDIFDNPPLHGAGWIGFTRDRNQLEGIFAIDAEKAQIFPAEYLQDLLAYRESSFQFEETNRVLDALCTFLQFAVDNHLTITGELT